MPVRKFKPVTPGNHGGLHHDQDQHEHLERRRPIAPEPSVKGVVAPVREAVDGPEDQPRRR